MQSKEDTDKSVTAPVVEKEKRGTRTRTVFCVNKPEMSFLCKGKFKQKPMTSGSGLAVVYEPADGEPWGEHSIWPQPWQGRWKQIDETLVELEEVVE